jgi:hypothetical protein
MEKEKSDGYLIIHEIILISPITAPILLAVGGYILTSHFPFPVLCFTTVGLIIGALGVSIPRIWLEFSPDERKTYIGRITRDLGISLPRNWLGNSTNLRESSKKRSGSALWKSFIRLGMFFLSGLCLIISVFYIYHGIQVRNLLIIPIGFLSTLLSSLVLLASILHRIGFQVKERIPAVISLVITMGLSIFILIATQVKVGSACFGQGLVNAAPYSDGSGPHRVEVVQYDRRFWYWVLPKDWQPISVEETELVACFGPVEEYIIETCQYHGFDITRYGYHRQVVLRTAKTGEIIASTTFTGKPPRQCNQTEESSTVKLKGNKWVDPSDVWQWLTEYVEEDRTRTDVVELQVEEPLAVRPEPTVSKVETVFPEPLEKEPTPEQPPSALVTPGNQPPDIGVITGYPSLMSAPSPGGEFLGIIIMSNESVEVLAFTDEWIQVSWVKPEGTEITGWVQKHFVEIAAPDAVP